MNLNSFDNRGGAVTAESWHLRDERGDVRCSVYLNPYTVPVYRAIVYCPVECGRSLPEQQTFPTMEAAQTWAHDNVDRIQVGCRMGAHG